MLCCFCLGISAQTTDSTQVSTIRTDTLRMVAEVYSSDDLLLDLVAQQSQSIHERDSIEQEEALRLKDSLLTDFYHRDSLLMASIQYLQDSVRQIRDSINLLRADEIAQQAYEDSIQKVVHLQDSVAQEIAKLQAMPDLKITPSLIQDVEEDLRQMRALRKNIFSPWHADAMVQLQFSQSYITDNWYQGGTKLNLTLLGIAKGNLRYKKDRILWESLGEWRAGLANAPSDTLRKFNVNDDIFRIYTKLGYQIIQKLYLATSAEFKTPLWNTWSTNTTSLTTTFLTPIRFNLDLGVDYRPVDWVSISVAPITYKMVYANRIDEKINETNFGIAEGEHLLNDFGSSMRVKFKWIPVREIVLENEFYLYTNYTTNIEIDWQVDCNLILTRFLSARISLHPRYDNLENKKLQFKELISLGFAHKFQ